MGLCESVEDDERPKISITVLNQEMNETTASKDEKDVRVEKQRPLAFEPDRELLEARRKTCSIIHRTSSGQDWELDDIDQQVIHPKVPKFIQKKKFFFGTIHTFYFEIAEKQLQLQSMQSDGIWTDLKHLQEIRKSLASRNSVASESRGHR